MSQLIGMPIESPTIPCVVPIPGGTKVGLIVRIQGHIPVNAYRFSVNMTHGATLSDIAFHFNPRFDKGVIVRNHCVGNSWGSEEDSDPSILPLTRGSTFEIMVLVESSQYKVAVNGSHLLSFAHRMPFESVNTLQIMGDVNVYKLEFLDSSPVKLAPEYGFKADGIADNEILNPTIPFTGPIPYDMEPGRSIFITGRPKPYATRFSINLKCASENDSDICFHFNPRFGGRGDEKSSVIARNTKINGNWGNEERSTPFFPFHHGFNFDLNIFLTNSGFLMSVNGQHLISYSHRLPCSTIKSLNVEGEVDITLIRFH